MKGLFLIGIGTIHLIVASALDPLPEIYAELSNIYNPTKEDFLRLQERLTNAERPILARMLDTEFIARNFKIIGEIENETPWERWEALNCSENERENCIVIYASFNRRYPVGVERLVRAIKKTNFRGHLYYRVGGWPNMEEGDLVLAHVPFAFKVCYLRKMRRLGYKRALWLDSSILPWVNLNKVFELIRQRGFFVQANSHSVGIYVNEDAAKALGVTVKEAYNIKSCSAAIVGIDFTNPRTAPILDAWYEAAKDPYAFFSARSDQTALSVILHKFKLSKFMWPDITLGEPGSTRPETLFLMDRRLVKDYYTIRKK